MPITSITIENFKGIGEKAVTIPIRPITLLFGKNSAGKSTVLQALRYFFKVKNQWPNLGRIEMSGGLNTDLDNFHSLVHRHELDRKIRIRVKWVLVDSHTQNSPEQWREIVTGWKEGDHYLESYLVGEVLETGEEICFSGQEKKEKFADAVIGSKGEKLIFWKKLKIGDGDIVGQIYVNTTDLSNQAKKHIDYLHESLNPKDPKIIQSVGSVLFGSVLLSLNPVAFGLGRLVAGLGLTKIDSLQESQMKKVVDNVVGSGQVGFDMRHLGPFREVPPREYEIPQTPDESQWQKGLGAWDALARDPKLVEKTNHYLKEVLQIGYTIKQPEPGQNFQLHDENNEIDVGLSDVGVGIAQVIPVVVGALDDSPNTFAVEQPELHVHPAVQVALGDVFIDSVKHRDQAHDQAIAEFWQKIENALEIKEFIENLEESKRIEPLIIELGKNIAKKDPEFIELLKENIDAIEKSNRTLLLIETHSEHLLLRLLRRVRETTEGEQTEHPLTPDDLSVIYVRSTPEGVEFIPISVTEDGDFEVLWPEGFFDERVEELF